MPLQTYSAAPTEPVPGRESAQPDDRCSFDVETDVLVVGSGAGGLASALFSSWLGEEVVLLEKAPELGGTTRKASFIYWIPNNRPMREEGIEDPEEDFLRYVARISRPEKYDPDSPTFGQSQWEFEMYKAFYECAAPAAEMLHDRGALPYRHAAEYFTDYFANLPEDKVSAGRTLAPAGSDDASADGGIIGIEFLSRAAEEAGIDVRPGHRVQRVIMRDGAVLGVAATTTDGEEVRVGARKGVIFATGGFTHDKELSENFLEVPVMHGCAARTNEGDFVRIGAAAGGQLRNMQYAWYTPHNLEKGLSAGPDFNSTFILAGDSMIAVNYRGERCLNERLPYNELAHAMVEWDPINSQYPNRVLIQIWDQHSQDHSAVDYYGNSITPEGLDDSHVIEAGTLAELRDRIGERLRKLRAHTGDLELSDDFLPTLEATIARWNELAAIGVDEDFHRGERTVELTMFAGPLAEEPGKKNDVMWPISGTGPYYATLLVPGTLDTKGGPKTNTWGQVVDDMDQPIPGLYGVGNCVASLSARGYWAAGGTIGPALTFAYRAAQAIHEEPSRRLVPAAAADRAQSP